MLRLNKLILASVAALGLAACQTDEFAFDHYGHSDRMAINSGEAIAANRVAQMVDPWPAAARDRNFSTSGIRMQKAMDKYNGVGTAAAASSSTGGSSASSSGTASSSSSTAN